MGYYCINFRDCGHNKAIFNVIHLYCASFAHIAFSGARPPFSLGGSRPSPHTRTLTCVAIQPHIVPLCCLSDLHLRNPRITHLPTPKGWKAELAWLGDTCVWRLKQRGDDSLHPQYVDQLGSSHVLRPEGHRGSRQNDHSERRTRTD